MEPEQRMEWLEQRVARLEQEIDVLKRRLQAVSVTQVAQVVQLGEAPTERTDRQEIAAILQRRRQSKDSTTALVRRSQASGQGQVG